MTRCLKWAELSYPVIFCHMSLNIHDTTTFWFWYPLSFFFCDEHVELTNKDIGESLNTFTTKIAWAKSPTTRINYDNKKQREASCLTTTEALGKKFVDAHHQRKRRMTKLIYLLTKSALTRRLTFVLNTRKKVKLVLTNKVIGYNMHSMWSQVNKKNVPSQNIEDSLWFRWRKCLNWHAHPCQRNK